jgi:hypothetical protein
LRTRPGKSRYLGAVLEKSSRALSRVTGCGSLNCTTAVIMIFLSVSHSTYQQASILTAKSYLEKPHLSTRFVMADRGRGKSRPGDGLMPEFLNCRRARCPVSTGSFWHTSCIYQSLGPPRREETVAMTNLELNQNQPEIMGAIAASYLSGPHLEVADPEKKALRNELKQKEVFLKHVPEHLQAA